ncbi:MAG: hypothetical protein QGF67_05965 [Lentisphaeria bacterium]|jgi:hypothetical protein|nr:hypothetical protein [Lentisphaeria bacterium]
MQHQECIAAQMSYKPGETGHQSALTHTPEITAVDFDLQVKNRKNGNLYQGVKRPKTRLHFSTAAFDASRPLFWQREIHNMPYMNLL